MRYVTGQKGRRVYFVGSYRLQLDAKDRHKERGGEAGSPLMYS